MSYIRTTLILLTITIQFVTLNAKEVRTTVIYSGEIRDSQTRETLPYATVILEGEERYSAISDDDGNFKILNIPLGSYNLSISYIGYAKQELRVSLYSDRYDDIQLTSDYELQEVVVTATESNGMTASSIINREAMSHLQPTSFADLMELLPGGISKDPNMGSANTVSLRETGTLSSSGTSSSSSDYSISSLGTLFIVDGAPINTDVNMQYTPLSSTINSSGSLTAEENRNITNKGVDMRSISTDDIESVEVIRGIPSVEYGNLTSGVINIKKIRKETPITARFKVDGFSKLFSMGKGFSASKERDIIINIDGGYLDSKVDPTNNLENYQRINGSLRLTSNVLRSSYALRISSTVDYTGSIDNSKEDPDINFGNIDEYKSVYNRGTLGNNLKWTFPKRPAVKLVDLNSSVSLQYDKLSQTLLVSPQRYGLAPTNTESGEYDATVLFSEYTSTYQCEGIPFTAYIKLKSEYEFKIINVNNNIKVGAQWDYSKNFGTGQIYDLSTPLSATGNWSSRPRAYSEIPAIQNLSLFAEEYLTTKVGNNSLDILAGVRTNSLVGLDSRYALHGKVYLDPRLNIKWSFPKIKIGRQNLNIALVGGLGWTTKMPTLNYLYPDSKFIDITQLAYYDTSNPTEYSRFNVVSYEQDQTNYDIEAARNRKWEVSLDLSYGENRLSVGYFNEAMSSGFRYVNVYSAYSYKDYDESSIVSSSLQSQPDLSTIPYVETSKLESYRLAENGSTLNKQGVELQFSSQRIKPIRTAINITGAWFRSTYSNSLPLFISVSDVVDNVSVSDMYVGLYDWEDGQKNHTLTSNITLDTQVPEWGFIFTTSIQTSWYIKRQLLWRDGTPVAYLSVYDGEIHPYTDESATDLYLQYLIISENSEKFNEMTVPMSLYVNFKATKSIGKYLSLSLFVNKILDYTPDYESNGVTIRRNVDAYFGIELNLKI